MVTTPESSVTLPDVTAAVTWGWSLLPVIEKLMALVSAVALPSPTWMLPKLSVTLCP